jgi:hypothetical protein
MQVGTLPAVSVRRSGAPVRQPGSAEPSGAKRARGRDSAASRAAVFGQRRRERAGSRTRGAGTRPLGRQRAPRALSPFGEAGSGHLIRIRWTKAQGSIERSLVATPGKATAFAMEQGPEAEGAREANWRAVLARQEGERKANATAGGQRPR